MSSLINTSLIVQSLPSLLRGASVTVLIAFVALGIGLFAGLLLAITQTMGGWFARRCVDVYVTIIRGTPMLIQIFFLNFVLLPLLGIEIPALWGAILAIGINSSAYMSQIIRSGIQSVSYGQIEAARTLGIRRRDIMQYIILPQALRTILPALGNESITLIKDSSLASLIGVMELYNESKVIISQTYDALSLYTITGIIYLILTGTLSCGIYLLEKKLNRHADYSKSL